MRTSGQITLNLLVHNLHIPYKYTHGDFTFFLANNFGTYLATTSGEKQDGQDGQDGQVSFAFFPSNSFQQGPSLPSSQLVNLNMMEEVSLLYLKDKTTKKN